MFRIGKARWCPVYTHVWSVECTPNSRQVVKQLLLFWYRYEIIGVFLLNLLGFYINLIQLEKIKKIQGFIHNYYIVDIVECTLEC